MLYTQVALDTPKEKLGFVYKFILGKDVIIEVPDYATTAEALSVFVHGRQKAEFDVTETLMLTPEFVKLFETLLDGGDFWSQLEFLDLTHDGVYHVTEPQGIQFNE